MTYKIKRQFVGIPPEMLKKMRHNITPPGPDPSAAAFVDEVKKKEPFEDIFNGLKWLDEKLDESISSFAGR